MTVTTQSVLRKREGVVSRSLEDARIALRLDRTETLVFNASADRLWDLFDGTRSVAAVAAASGQAPAVMVSFAGQLVELGLFDVAEGGSDTIAEATAVETTETSGGTHGLVPPALVAREELAVLGGCTSTGLTCSFPSSGSGGAGRAAHQPPHPPHP